MFDLVLVILLITAGMMSLVGFIYQKIKKYSLRATLLKAITSFFFIAVAAVGLYHKGFHVLSIFILVGLVCGMLGDIWLALKHVYKDSDDLFTFAGFISFAIGHVLYISGMFFEFYQGQHVLFIIIPLLIGCLFGAGVPLLGKVMHLHLGKFLVISIIYGALLFSMCLVSLSLNFMTGWKSVTLIMLFIGGVLFTISDIILSRSYFGHDKDNVGDLISNSLTYYFAQYIIAFAIFFL